MNQTYFRNDAGSYDEALIKTQQALEIEEKELGARDQQMAYAVQVTVSYLDSGK